MVVVKTDYEVKNRIQYKALNRWVEKGKHGTVLMATGFGKTFVALHALYSMPKNDGKTHIFLAEVTDRYDSLLEEIRKYEIIFKRSILKHYKLQFKCYQSAYKLKGNNYGLVIADEIHDSLTPSYSRFYFNNNYDAIIGLSAKINRQTSYDLGQGEYVTKGQILDKVCPVVYSYQLKKAVQEETSRKLNVHIIYNDLDTKNPVIKAGSKAKPFFQTEYKAYKYWDSRHKKAFYIENSMDRDREIIKTAGKRSEILCNLQTKVYIVKLLLRYLNNKSIIFANSLDFLYKITENVVSSRNTESRNWQIKNWLEIGAIKFIGSFKKLKQGANLAKDLDNCIIASYYSSQTDLEQRIGRLRDNGTQGNVFIIVTKDTQEVKWFNSMMGDVKNLPIVEHDSVFDCIDYLKNEK